MIIMIAITLLLAIVLVVGVMVKDMTKSELKEFMTWGLVVTAGILFTVTISGVLAVLFKT